MNYDYIPNSAFDCSIHDHDRLDLLDTLLDRAKRGELRLAVIDEDVGLAHHYADPEEDLHIDADRGNWDIFADNYFGAHFQEVAGAMIRSRLPAPLRLLAVDCLGVIIEFVGREPVADLASIREQVRACNADEIRAVALRLEHPAPDDRDVQLVIAAMVEATRRFVARDPVMPAVSVERWLKGDPRAVLFITAHAPLECACTSVTAAINVMRM